MAPMPEQSNKQSRPAMNVYVQSSKLVKPVYQNHPPPPTDLHIPLSVFDKVTYDTHIAVIYAFHPPNPPNADIEAGLARALTAFRELAGRLGNDAQGNPVILLNDAGALLVEATSDAVLDNSHLLPPTPALLALHPAVHAAVHELVQVQLTRFACGSLVVGFTAQHLVADGRATSNFLLSWSLAVRRGDQPVLRPIPLRARAALFRPRDPPLVEFEHRGVEFAARNLFSGGSKKPDPLKDEVVVHVAHFSKQFLSRLKAEATPHTTFESLVAHLWRVTTRARGLCKRVSSEMRISVDGRARMRPLVPEDYFGNAVLWALPRAEVGELLSSPRREAAARVHEAIARMDRRYFQSFVDFTSSGAVEREGLVTTAYVEEWVMSPDLEVHSWLGFPFWEVDYGGGSPFRFMPTYSPVEGMLVLLPSFLRDGSIDVYVGLFNHNLAAFKQLCYALDD